MQYNRFNDPERQFNSIDDLLKLLSTTSQPREIIINNFENKTGYDTPLDYILSNAVSLESTQY